MTKTEYMNTINEKLTAAEGLCAAPAGSSGASRSWPSPSPAPTRWCPSSPGQDPIADKEAELKTVRGELQKARRIVKKLDEIEAIEAGTAPAPAPKKQAAKKLAAKKPAKAKSEQATKEPQATATRRPEKGVPG